MREQHVATATTITTNEMVDHIVTRGRWQRSTPLVRLDVNGPVLAVPARVREHWTIHRVQHWGRHPIAYRIDGVNIWPSSRRSMPFCAVLGNVMPIDRRTLWLSRYLETAMTSADRRWPYQQYRAAV